jgi:hypothetical protein
MRFALPRNGMFAWLNMVSATLSFHPFATSAPSFNATDNSVSVETLDPFS